MSKRVFSDAFIARSEQPASVQPPLFSELEMDLLTLDKPETQKRYTGASLNKQLVLREGICRALAEGWGLLRIAKHFGTSHHLVSALRDSRPDLVAIEKKQLSGQIGRILKLSADKYEEALVEGKVPAGQIPVAFGIFADKKAMLDGDPGMVIEHRHRVVGTAESFQARLRAAVEAPSTADGSNPQQKEIVDVDTVAQDTAPTAARADGHGPAEAPATGGGDVPAVPAAATSMHSVNPAAEQKDLP